MCAQGVVARADCFKQANPFIHARFGLFSCGVDCRGREMAVRNLAIRGSASGSCSRWTATKKPEPREMGQRWNRNGLEASEPSQGESKI